MRSMVEGARAPQSQAMAIRRVKHTRFTGSCRPPPPPAAVPLPRYAGAENLKLESLVRRRVKQLVYRDAPRRKPLRVMLAEKIVEHLAVFLHPV